MRRAVLGLFGAWFAILPVLYAVSFYIMEETFISFLGNDSLCKMKLMLLVVMLNEHFEWSEITYDVLQRLRRTWLDVPLD